jgi:hypothetical protein
MCESRFLQTKYNLGVRLFIFSGGPLDSCADLLQRIRLGLLWTTGAECNEH